MIKSNQFLGMAIFLIFITSCTNAQEINQKVTDTNGSEKLLGKINKDGLTQHSFAVWFSQEHQNYEVDSEITQSIKDELKKYKITAFLGTWCGDSKREVPRFYKILEKAEFPMNYLSMIAVDNERANYKKSPGGEEKGLDIIKVPTFIFYRDGKEVNRIVEYPVESLEKDMAAILGNKSYTPNYSAVSRD